MPAFAVVYSPDGQRLAYVTVPEGSLWSSRTDGGGRLRLTPEPFDVLFPKWSPAGDRIAFGGGEPGSDRSQVYLVSPQGGPPQKVPTQPCFDASYPSWSTDGFTVMFECIMPGDDGTHATIRTADLRTGQTAPLAGSEGCQRPAWSPDGRYVAALHLGTEVVLYDFSARRWRRLAIPAHNATYGRPFWARNSRWLYFQQGTGDAEEPIFRADVATGTVKRAMTAQQIPQSRLSVYGLTGMTPQDDPIATVVRTNGDLYALDVDLP
jgi:Tol biopolymer transport system component